MAVGKSIQRKDAYEKVTGRARYTEDYFERDMLFAKVLHSRIANGRVTKMDISEAEKIDGVVKIITCFDVPNIPFPTAGHPWSTDVGHQDVMDRLLLNARVRYHGDDIAAVIATNEVAASQACKAIKVEYEEYEPLLSPEAAMKENAIPIHEKYPDNVLGKNAYEIGDYEEAIKEEGLIKFEGTYVSPMVQHCHIEPPVSYAYEDMGKIVVVSSTQIPHIIRRVVGQALGIPWGRVRIIKPCLGGGFGNKQDALYEPLNAYLTTLVGGRPVKLALSREETFVSTRTRHQITFKFETYVRKDGTFVARAMESVSNQGAYASHGHSIAAKGTTAFKQLYPYAPAIKAEAKTVFTNLPVGGAMRGYGTPQVIFALESHVEDIAKGLGMNSLELREKNMMRKGFFDGFAKLTSFEDSLMQCVEKGKEYIKYDEKIKEYANQTGAVRKGIGMSLFWYNTGVWPISLEATTCRMVMNQDGSVQVQLPETEIGQGADTAFAQMTAQTLGIDVDDVFVVSSQDTDVTPFGTSAYASRQTYVAGMGIKDTGEILREKVLNQAARIYEKSADELNIEGGKIVFLPKNKILGTVGDVATEALYSMTNAEHLIAEHTTQCNSNALSLGCCFADIEVDIPLGRVKVNDVVNVHDCGTLINPQLAEMQVHGGMSMSLGYALSEQMLFDEKTGAMRNDNLLDYKLPTIMDQPDFHAIFVENAEPTHPFGAKALGEPPAVPVAPAVRNAVLNATGVSFNEAPLTPERLIASFREEGLLDAVKKEEWGV